MSDTDITQLNKNTDKIVLNNVIIDLVSHLLYYDRKGDEDLPLGKIEAMIKAGETSVEDIVDIFKIKLIKGLKL